MQRITGNVKAVLVDGVEQGLGTREIGTNLRGVIDDISARQAEGIARTEVNSAANRGNFMAMEEADVEFVQWIAAQDTRTRPDHLAHHGLASGAGSGSPTASGTLETGTGRSVAGWRAGAWRRRISRSGWSWGKRHLSLEGRDGDHLGEAQIPRLREGVVHAGEHRWPRLAGSREVQDATADQVRCLSVETQTAEWRVAVG